MSLLEISAGQFEKFLLILMRVGGIIAAFPPEVSQKIIDETLEATNEMSCAGFVPVVLASPNIRLGYKRLIAAALPRVAVISFNELIPNIEVESIKTVRMPNEN
jgi:flagellar biosynthesis protein FlhA